MRLRFRLFVTLLFCFALQATAQDPKGHNQLLFGAWVFDESSSKGLREKPVNRTLTISQEAETIVFRDSFELDGKATSEEFKLTPNGQKETIGKGAYVIRNKQTVPFGSRITHETRWKDGKLIQSFGVTAGKGVLYGKIDKTIYSVSNDGTILTVRTKFKPAIFEQVHTDPGQTRPGFEFKEDRVELFRRKTSSK